MGVFLPTVNQMGFLMLLIIIGYIIVRLNVVQSEGTVLLSRLENNVFVPALILDTFVNNLTIEKISDAWKYLLGGTILILITSFLAVFLSKFLIASSNSASVKGAGDFSPVSVLSFSEIAFLKIEHTLA